jgi:hypothetical protein
MKDVSYETKIASGAKFKGLGSTAELSQRVLATVARFFLIQHTKTTSYTIKYTKWPQNIPNGSK